MEYYRCMRCGLTLPGIDSDLTIHGDCFLGHDHDWKEFPDPREKNSASARDAEGGISPLFLGLPHQ